MHYMQNARALKLSIVNSAYNGISPVLFRACLLRNQLLFSRKQSQSYLNSNLKCKLYNISTICRTF